MGSTAIRPPTAAAAAADFPATTDAGQLNAMDARPATAAAQHVSDAAGPATGTMGTDAAAAAQAAQHVGSGQENAPIDVDGFTRIQVSRHCTPIPLLSDCPHTHSNVFSVNKFASIGGEKQVDQDALGPMGTCVGADGRSMSRGDITVDGSGRNTNIVWKSSAKTMKFHNSRTADSSMASFMKSSEFKQLQHNNYCSDASDNAISRPTGGRTCRKDDAISRPTGGRTCEGDDAISRPTGGRTCEGDRIAHAEFRNGATEDGTASALSSSTSATEMGENKNVAFTRGK